MKEENFLNQTACLRFEPTDRLVPQDTSCGGPWDRQAFGVEAGRRQHDGQNKLARTLMRDNATTIAWGLALRRSIERGALEPIVFPWFTLAGRAAW